MIIKAILFDVNGTLIDINTDEANEEIYRGISHILTYQGISMHRWEVRDEYYRIMDVQRKTSQEKYPEFNVVELFREFINRRFSAPGIIPPTSSNGCRCSWPRPTGASPATACNSIPGCWMF